MMFFLSCRELFILKICSNEMWAFKIYLLSLHIEKFIPYYIYEKVYIRSYGDEQHSFA